MIAAELEHETDFGGWRRLARGLLAEAIAPDAVDWKIQGAPSDLLSAATFQPSAAKPASPMRVSKRFIDLARRTICHTDPQRFARLYHILFRLQARTLHIDQVTDDDIRWLMSCDKAVRRDIHKTHAFVRFRETGTDPDGRETFAAWFEPTHRTLELSAPFFQRRFPNMDWIIVTPDRTACWDGRSLRFSEGGQRSDVPPDDAVEDQWRTYFRSIFNPARLKISAMTSEMPRKYWKNLPEADLIPELIATAPTRARSMQAQPLLAPNPLATHLDRQRAAQAAPAPTLETFAGIRSAISACQRCPLCKDASQSVSGEGPEDARLMIVGEQPGDQEDIAGRPLMGPAGQLLDTMLAEAGLDRSAAYVTNAVKHFKFTPRGKRRMHQRPNAGEIDTCRWWLDLERQQVQPDLIIALGASAARGVLGHSVRISDVRGKIQPVPGGASLLVTVHPAYLLRLPDADRALTERQHFAQDLRMSRSFLDGAVKGTNCREGNGAAKVT